MLTDDPSFLCLCSPHSFLHQGNARRRWALWDPVPCLADPGIHIHLTNNRAGGSAKMTNIWTVGADHLCFFFDRREFDYFVGGGGEGPKVRRHTPRGRIHAEGVPLPGRGFPAWLLSTAPHLQFLWAFSIQTLTWVEIKWGSCEAIGSRQGMSASTFCPTSCW